MRTSTCSRLFLAAERLDKAILNACGQNLLTEEQAHRLADAIEACCASAEPAGKPEMRSPATGLPMTHSMLSLTEQAGMDDMLRYGTDHRAEL